MVGLTGGGAGKCWGDCPAVAALRPAAGCLCAHRPLVLQPVPEHARLDRPLWAPNPPAISSTATASQKPGGYEAVELKAVNHRLDGVLWPQRGLAGTARQPVVKLKLELQMHSKPGFKHRLGAQTLRFLQLHPKVRHLQVVVVVPHHRLNLGPARLPRQLRLVLDEVIWISLEELCLQDHLDPLLNLLTLPVLHEPELQRSSQQILEGRPDLAESVFPILMQRHPNFTLEQMMVVVKIPTQELRHSRSAQQLIDEGQADGRRAEAASITLRQLSRRCGPLSEATTTRSRPCRWSCWRPWGWPCSISAAPATWPPGWRSTAAEHQLRLLTC